MGTRNLTCVVLNGEYKVAQYAQWDGYPSGQGLTILSFLRNKFDRETFLSRLAQCRFVTNDEMQAVYKELGADGSGYVSMDISNKFIERFPYIDRDHGGEILEMIQNRSDEPVLKNSITFAGDSLFCEWGYVVDLDKNTFEVYRGFNHAKLDQTERFANVEKDSDEYEPIKHLVTFDITSLPSDEDFLAIDKDEEEAA